MVARYCRKLVSLVAIVISLTLGLALVFSSVVMAMTTHEQSERVASMPRPASYFSYEVQVDEDDDEGPPETDNDGIDTPYTDNDGEDTTDNDGIHTPYTDNDSVDTLTATDNDGTDSDGINTPETDNDGVETPYTDTMVWIPPTMMV